MGQICVASPVKWQAGRVGKGSDVRACVCGGNQINATPQCWKMTNTDATSRLLVVVAVTVDVFAVVVAVSIVDVNVVDVFDELNFFFYLLLFLVNLFMLFALRS